MINKLKSPVFLFVAILTIVVAFIVLMSTYVWNGENILPTGQSGNSNKRIQYDANANVVGHFELAGSDLFPDNIIFKVDRLDIDEEAWVKELGQKVNEICIWGYSGEIEIDGKQAFSHSDNAEDIQYPPNCSLSEKISSKSNSDGIDIQFAGGLGYRSSTLSGYFPIASFYMANEYINLSNEKYSLYPNTRDYFTYPFDSINVKMELSIIYYYYDASIKSVAVASSPVALSVFQEDWKLGNYRIVVASNENRDAISYDIKFSRPIMLKYFTGLLIFFFLLIPSFITLVGNIGEAIQIAIAFFLGAWGFRQIIVPSVEINQSLIDIAFLAEYSLVIISLLLTVYTFSRRNNEEVGEGNKTSMHYFSLPSSKVFHSPHCPVIAKSPISSMNKYNNIHHAKRSGKRPCKFCL